MEERKGEDLLEVSLHLMPPEDTFQESIEPKVLQLSKHQLRFTSILTARKSLYDPGRDCAFHRAVPIEDGTIFITGASGKEYMVHSCMLFDGKKVLYSHESEQGISSVCLVAVKRSVYLVGGKWCERYDLDSKKMVRIEAPINPHLSGGACVYNGNVLLIGGINCRTVEMYLVTQRHWAEVATLQENLYNIASIQVLPGQVLVFGGGTRNAWLLDVENGGMRNVANVPESVSDTNVIADTPVLYKGKVYCFVGASREAVLLTYSIMNETWEVIQRREVGCCSLS